MKYWLLCVICVWITGLTAQEKISSPVSDSVMITVFLKHQQDKSLDEIQQIQRENGFYQNFPPPFARVVSWYVMMGIGQVVTIKIPAAQLRDLNVILEKTAWKAFNTEFYPTYDFAPVYREIQQKENSSKP